MPSLSLSTRSVLLEKRLGLPPGYIFKAMLPDMTDYVGLSAKRLAPTTPDGTYFIDDVNGSDAGTGAYGDPWKTIAKVNGTTLATGSVVLFRCGGVWREQLTAPSAGTEGNQIVFGAYGDEDALPEITGANIATGFAATATPHVYSASIAVDPRIVLFESIVGSKKASLEDLTDDADWFYSLGVLSVYFPYLPSDTTIEFSARSQSIYSRKNYVTIQDILAGNCQNSWAAPITSRLDGVAIFSNIIQRCTVKNGSTGGIYLLNADGCQVLENNIENIWNGTTYASGGDGVGIRLLDIDNVSTGNKVSRNIVKNAYVGAKLQGGVLNTEINFNRIITPLVNGIDLYQNPAADGPVTVLNNIVHFRPTWDAGHGIDLQDVGSDGAIIKNNIVYCDFTGPNNNVELICINPTPASIDIDNNLYFMAPGCTASIGKLNTTKYTTLASWQAALAGTAYSGKDIQSLDSDPRFVDVANGDFTLQQNSPCIRTGTKTALTGTDDIYDADGYKIYDGTYQLPDGHFIDGVDIGAYAYGGANKVYLKLANPSTGVYMWESAPDILDITGVNNAVYNLDGTGKTFATQDLALAAMVSLENGVDIVGGIGGKRDGVAIWNRNLTAAEALKADNYFG